MFRLPANQIHPTKASRFTSTNSSSAEPLGGHGPRFYHWTSQLPGRHCYLDNCRSFFESAHFGMLPIHFTSHKVAQLFIEIVCKLHGFPKSLISDRDPIFMSRFWCELFKLNDTKLRMSMTYHPKVTASPRCLTAWCNNTWAASCTRNLSSGESFHVLLNGVTTPHAIPPPTYCHTRSPMGNHQRVFPIIYQAPHLWRQSISFLLLDKICSYTSREKLSTPRKKWRVLSVATAGTSPSTLMIGSTWNYDHTGKLLWLAITIKS